MRWNNLSIPNLQVWEWISNFIPHFTGHLIKLNHVSKRGRCWEISSVGQGLAPTGHYMNQWRTRAYSTIWHHQALTHWGLEKMATISDILRCIFLIENEWTNDSYFSDACMYWCVYMKDNSWINFIFCIVESSHAHQHCLHAWPTLIHGNSGHVAVRAGARERYLMNRSQDARS